MIPSSHVSSSCPVNSVCSDVDVCVDPKMEPPSSQQLLFLRQIVLSGLGDHVARFAPVCICVYVHVCASLCV